MKKILAGIVAAVYSVMLVAAPVLAQTAGVDATVTVAAVCEFSVDPTAINFGSTDGTSNEQTLGPGTVTASNDGNTDITSLTVEGTNWSGPAALGVGATSFEDDGEDPGAGFPFNEALALSPGTVIYGSPPLADEASDTVDFKVTIPADQPAGDYSQTITFTFGCDSIQD